MLTVDHVEYDLNSLFTLTYSFDVLKRLIEGLAKTQKDMQQKMNDMEHRLIQKDKKIELIEKELMIPSSSKDYGVIHDDNALGVMYTGKNKSDKGMKIGDDKHDPRHSKDVTEDITGTAKDSRKSLLKTEENRRDSQVKADQAGGINTQTIIREKIVYREEIQDRKKDNDNVIIESKENETEAVNEPDQDEQIVEKMKSKGVDTEIIAALLKRVGKLEKKMDDMQRLNSDLYNLEGRVRDHSDAIDDHFNSISEVKKLCDELFEKTEKMNTTLEQINVKVSDFNIYDLFKGNDGEGGSVDVTKALVSSLESKVFKKFGLLDEKIKKAEEELFKNKNDTTNLKNLSESNSRTLTNLKEDNKKLVEDIKYTNDQNAQQSLMLEKKVDDNYKTVVTKIDDVMKELKEMLNTKEEMFKRTEENLNHELLVSKEKTGGMSENDLKILKEMNKKIYDLEKSLKMLSASVNLDSIREEIQKIKEELPTRATLQDIYDINDKMNLNAVSVNHLKENNERLIDESKKSFSDINWLMKKIESISATLVSIKNEDGNTSGQHKGNIIDTNKFVDVNAFNDFVKAYVRDIDRLKREDDDIRRYIDEIMNTLKSKASDKDLKNLEEYLLSKLEELKLQASKKFADKIDTQKNIKYIDAQVKHIIDVYIKKMEKGDNWLLAKKPINGYSCASCEAYIGDLHDKNEYIAWNKYPIRDPNEKAYRIGNGFSRMLQMLNVDVKKSGEMIPSQPSDAEKGTDSEGEMKRPLSGSGKKKAVLPKVKIGKHSVDEVINMSADDIIEDYQDQNAPKVVKIYKKIKAANFNDPPKNAK